MPPAPRLVPATAADLPMMQNLARFYVYDMARDCGGLPGWACPADGLWECIDLAPCFGDPARHPFLLRSGEAPAGFVVVRDEQGVWDMEQFFVAGPHQRRGTGRRIFAEVLRRFPGRWRIEVIPENRRALAFWRAMTRAADPGVRESLDLVDYGATRDGRVVLRFRTAGFLR